MAGNGWGEEAAGDERAWLRGRLRTAADGCGRQMGGENCADGCGRRGCNGMAGNGWGEGKGKERLGKEGTGRERKGQEEKGRERIGKDEKGRKREEVSDLGCADGCGRQVVWRTARTAADGVGATEWLEMGGEKDAAHEPECSHVCYMQSLRTIFCNSLFEQSCIYIFPL